MLAELCISGPGGPHHHHTREVNRDGEVRRRECVPVHPDDRPLLGMKWKDQLYVEAALPFGLRSAPKIFNAVADAMEWILREHGVKTSLHYLLSLEIRGRRNARRRWMGHSSCANVWEFL